MIVIKSDDDSDTRRMKERMERAMNDDFDSEVDDDSEPKPKEEEYDSDLDAAAHELNDGFFNIKEWIRRRRRRFSLRR